MSRSKKKRQSKRKPKKNHSKKSLAGASVTGANGANTAALGKKARASLESGDNRRALEGFKRLVKIDADTYIAGLITAASGYFDECLNESKTGPAKATLRTIEGLVPETTVATMHLRIALCKNDHSTAASIARDLLDHTDAPPAAKRCAADALVALPPDTRGKNLNWPEPAIIDQALSHAAAGEFAEAATAIQSLDRRSPFAHWRMFFKAVGAHARGDSETAHKALSRLDGACARTAQAWIKPDSATLATALRLHGEMKLADALPALSRLDGRAAYPSAFTRLIDSCQEFPSLDGVGATLTDYLTAGMSQVDGAERDILLISRKVRSSPLSAYGIFVGGRTIFNILMSLQRIQIGDALMIENVIAEARAAFPGQGDSAEAHLLRHYALDFLKREVRGGRPGADSLPARWLKKAILLRPDWAGPAVDLARCYQIEDDSHNCDIAIDAMVKKFPANLEVLYRAGEASMHFDSNVRAQEFFLSLLECDPLNDTARSRVVMACMFNSENCLEVGDTAAAKAAADLAWKHSRDSLPYIQRPGKILLQCGDLFERYLSSQAARPYYDLAAEKTTPDAFTFMRYASSRASMMGRETKARKFRRPGKNFFKTASFTHPIEMAEFLTATARSYSLDDFDDCIHLFDDYLLAAVDHDPDWYAATIRCARQMLAFNALPILLETLSDAVASKAPEDPLVVVLDIAGVCEPPDLPDLRSLRENFSRKGSTEAVALCDEIQKKIGSHDYERDDHYDDGGTDNFEPNSFEEELAAMVDALIEFGPKPKKKAKKKAAKKKAAKKAAKKKIPKTTTKVDPYDDAQLDLPF